MPVNPVPPTPGAADDGVRRVPCPTCGRPAVFARDNPWRPFCTQRCREVDLGAWASDSYRIPVEEADDGAGGVDAGPAAEPPGRR